MINDKARSIVVVCISYTIGNERIHENLRNALAAGDVFVVIVTLQ